MKSTTKKPKTKPSFWHQYKQPYQESAILCRQWHEELTALMVQYHAALAEKERTNGPLLESLTGPGSVQSRGNGLTLQLMEYREAKGEAEAAVKLHERRVAGLDPSLGKAARRELAAAQQEVASLTAQIAATEKEIAEIRPRLAEAEAALAQAKQDNEQAAKAAEDAEYDLFTVAGPGNIEKNVMPLLRVLIHEYRARKLAELETWSDGAPNFSAEQIITLSSLGRIITAYAPIFTREIEAKKIYGITLLIEVLTVICSEQPDFKTLLTQFISRK